MLTSMVPKAITFERTATASQILHVYVFLSLRSTDKQVDETLKTLIANGYDLEKVCEADTETLEPLLTVNSRKWQSG